MAVSAVGPFSAHVPTVAFTDPHNARLLYLAAFGLFALGIAMAVGTRYWWRNSRSEHPARGRLESMRVVRPVTVPEPAAPDVVEALPATVGEVNGSPVNGEVVAGIDPGLRQPAEVLEEH